MVRSEIRGLVAFAVLLSVAGCSLRQPAMRRPSDNLYPGKEGDLTEQESRTEEFLRQAVGIPACGEYFGQFFSTAYVVVRDFDNLCFTVDIRDGKASLKRGIDVRGNPDLVVPMTADDCEGLLNILKDGQITDAEEYRIFHVTFVPSYRSMLMKDDMYDPRVLKFLNVPDLMHVVLKNDANYTYGQSTRPVGLSIARVADQWIAFEGLQGEPGLRMEVTVAQAKEFTKITRKAVKDPAMPREAKMQLLAEIKTFLDSVTVFRR